MRATTQRFSEAVYAAMQREAGREGITIAQFVREAVVARIAWLEAQRARGEADDRSAAKPDSD